MESVAEIISKKYAKIASIRQELVSLFERIKNIFVKTENIYIDRVEEAMQIIQEKKQVKMKSMGDLLTNYNESKKTDIILEIINSCFNKVLDAKINVETFLSQTYVDETREYNNRINILFKKLKSALTPLNAELLSYAADIIFYDIRGGLTKFKEFNDLAKDLVYSADLVRDVANKAIEYYSKEDINAVYEIMALIENNKNECLAEVSNGKKMRFNSNNPHIKNYGLFPLTKLGDINMLSETIFPDEAPAKNIKAFAKLCATKSYDVLVIRKYLNRGINYNILDLMDFEKTKAFEKNHSSNDGIAVETVERYNTIEYISSKQIDWDIKYDYMHNTPVDTGNKFIVVLQELYPDRYLVLSNKLDAFERSYVIRKTQVKELIQFVEAQSYTSTRVNNYNKIINEKILDNMFLATRPDVENLKIKSQIIDPKYLRNEIYVLVLSKFRELHGKTKVRSIYDFSKLVHSVEFERLFSDIIMNEYYKYLFKNNSIYEAENISISEIYTSFLYTISIYERDFKKKIHDSFLRDMGLIPEEIFTKEFDEEARKQSTLEFFDALLKTVLGDIITSENNIFQSLIYKLYLFKLSILD